MASSRVGCSCYLYHPRCSCCSSYTCGYCCSYSSAFPIFATLAVLAVLAVLAACYCRFSRCSCFSRCPCCYRYSRCPCCARNRCNCQYPRCLRLPYSALTTRTALAIFVIAAIAILSLLLPALYYPHNRRNSRYPRYPRYTRYSRLPCAAIAALAVLVALDILAAALTIPGVLIKAAATAASVLATPYSPSCSKYGHSILGSDMLRCWKQRSSISTPTCFTLLLIATSRLALT